MFAVIYRFRVRPGYEQKFQESWSERTEEIKATFGGLGSRLHRASDGTWIAYAQWPSRDAWEALGPSTSESTPAQQIMREACEFVETLFELDVVKDLLVHS
ncbi:MAG TPA: antibiotic biosynthesis monooxygenase family protein [Oculatellaceae cyanobacterium]